MTEINRLDFFPFSEAPNGRIEEGLHSDIFNLGDNWVMKKIKLVWQRGNWQKRLSSDLQLLNHYLDPFIPTTSLVICSEANTAPTMVIVQKRVRGRTLRQVSWQELAGNTNTIGQLEEFREKVQLMYDQTGMTPDLHGGTKNFLKQYDFKYSNNLLITEQGQVRWTDIDRLGPLWSPDWVGGRIHMALMIRAFSAFIHKLQQQSHRT